MVPVTVANLSISNMGFVVLLKSQTDQRTLPIFIGVPEAQAIALHLNGVEPPRPMTHDLLKNLLDAVEGRLDHVEIHDLQEATFYGRLVLSFESQRMEVDSRPSDAIALALRCKAQIFVANKVMDQAGIMLDDEKDEVDEDAPHPAPDSLEELQRELEIAIRDERYEDAAALRDQIQNRARTN